MDGGMSLFQDMRERGIWRGYERHVVALNPVLERMAERGMPVDPTAFAEVVQRLTDDYQAAKRLMQTLVPLEVKRTKAYKKTPKKLEGCIQREGVWHRVLPWSPSNKGLCAYMVYKGHPVPKAMKTGKDTTNALEIIRLARSTKDPLYTAVIQYRKAQTVLKNHVKNWKPGADDRVHTTFYFDPATGQLSSRRPNVQNAPKHDDPEFGGYAKVFRSMIKARPDHTILEFDFKSFHAQTLAFESEDKDYLRLAKLDIHSYLTAHLIHDPKAGMCLGLADDELRDYLAWIKKNNKFVRDYKAKRAILGYGFGMGYRKLFDMNKESFESQRDAKRTIDMLDSIFPVTKAWRTAIRQKAHDQGYLVSRHGYIRYFWEVFKFRGGEWSPGGDDSEAAIAFLPANDAFGEIKDRMLVIAGEGLDERYGMVNNVHDSLLFECHNRLVEEAIPRIKLIMEARSEILISPVVAPQGLSVEVDVQAGPDWAHIKGVA
jgi:DNA polymerase I-like protein with 3'-5' exonuclease and polymerase domains